ncbi:hypothetical protein [Roseimaritima ulvae]|uniref:Heparinase II/III-like protein n=1 Tax=Roseimaritima ulvae TaxID=980254 RepID=A0A5B9R6P3_9BACT|nr:hypothetical protein [Roseimaritima ulvae]QEG41993.1 hypothetical protein UC8_40220 [Roseimaritima ulvae]
MATVANNNPSAINDVSAKAAPATGEARQWPELQKRIAKRSKSRALANLWPDWDPHSGPLRWGYAAASGDRLPDCVHALSLLAAGQPVPKRLRVDYAEAAEAFCDSLSSPGLGAVDYAQILTWAYALPALSEQLDERLWWDVLNRLQTLQRSAVEQSGEESLLHLMLGGELGLVLAWRLADLPSCEAMLKPATQAALQWFHRGEEAIDAALADGGVYSRLALASGMRTRCLLKTAGKRKLKSAQQNVLWQLVTWAAATTNANGTAVFSSAPATALRDDTHKNGLLYTAAKELDTASLTPAVAAALGHSKSKGRLAWQVSLPEPSLYCEAQGLAAMLPEWDVRRGRVHVDCRDDQFRLQVHAGRPMLLSGQWQVSITSDGEDMTACGPWSEVCQYSDDDVHYLELEQPWSGDLKLQRQIMVVRDDRCVMLADAVISSPSSTSPALEYAARWEVSEAIKSEPEADTWEIIMGDTKSRALAMPLSLPEWRVGPNAGSFDVAADGSLVLRARGKNNLYAPLWIDCERSRFNKPRTWRQLTVAEFLRIVTPDEAVAFRIEVGSDHWFVYRSMMGRISRTALGKNLVADFYCGRFDPEDGYTEELVTVDDDEAEE